MRILFYLLLSLAASWAHGQTNNYNILDRPASTVTLTAGTSRDVVNPAEIVVCTSTCTVTPPSSLLVGSQLCVQNADNVATIITLAAVTGIQYESTARTAYGTAGHTMTSSGALKDQICLVAVTATRYNVFSSTGTWTNN